VTATIVDGAGSLVEPLASPDLLPLLVFTGVFAAAIPSLGFLTGIRAIGGVRAGILMLFEPVVGVALAAWLLDEALAPIQVVGAVAILAAAVLLQRAPRRAAADQAIVAAPGGP
jgi:drug/metabolite transporter (DMT)-like permease